MGGGTLAGGTAMWTKIQINICSCLGKNENDVLTIFIFYFYLAAAWLGWPAQYFLDKMTKLKLSELGRASAGVIIRSYQALFGGWTTDRVNIGMLDILTFNLAQIIWYHSARLPLIRSHCSALLIVCPDQLFFLPALRVFVKISLKEWALSETSAVVFLPLKSWMFYSELGLSPRTWSYQFSLQY